MSEVRDGLRALGCVGHLATTRAPIVWFPRLSGFLASTEARDIDQIIGVLKPEGTGIGTISTQGIPLECS